MAVGIDVGISVAVGTSVGDGIEVGSDVTVGVTVGAGVEVGGVTVGVGVGSGVGEALEAASTTASATAVGVAVLVIDVGKGDAVEAALARGCSGVDVARGIEVTASGGCVSFEHAIATTPIMASIITPKYSEFHRGHEERGRLARSARKILILD